MAVFTGSAAIGMSSILSADKWRSELVPEDWRPPTSEMRFETDKIIQDFTYAGYHRGERPIPEIDGPKFVVTDADFGADSNGSSDATEAIQRAIDAAEQAGGGVVFMPAGKYLLSVPEDRRAALVIRASNVVLRGAGRDETFLLNATTRMRGKSVILVSGPRDAGFFRDGAREVAITEDLLGPTTTIPVAETTGISVGDWVNLRCDVTEAWVLEHREPEWLGYTLEPFSLYEFQMQRRAKQRLNGSQSDGW